MLSRISSVLLLLVFGFLVGGEVLAASVYTYNYPSSTYGVPFDKIYFTTTDTVLPDILDSGEVVDSIRLKFQNGGSTCNLVGITMELGDDSGALATADSSVSGVAAWADFYMTWDFSDDDIVMYPTSGTALWFDIVDNLASTCSGTKIYYSSTNTYGGATATDHRFLSSYDAWFEVFTEDASIALAEPEILYPSHGDQITFEEINDPLFYFISGNGLSQTLYPDCQLEENCYSHVNIYGNVSTAYTCDMYGYGNRAGGDVRNGTAPDPSDEIISDLSLGANGEPEPCDYLSLAGDYDIKTRWNIDGVWTDYSSTVTISVADVFLEPEWDWDCTDEDGWFLCALKRFLVWTLKPTDNSYNYLLNGLDKWTDIEDEIGGTLNQIGSMSGGSYTPSSVVNTVGGIAVPSEKQMTDDWRSWFEDNDFLVGSAQALIWLAAWGAVFTAFIFIV